LVLACAHGGPGARKKKGLGEKKEEEKKTSPEGRGVRAGTLPTAALVLAPNRSRKGKKKKKRFRGEEKK